MKRQISCRARWRALATVVAIVAIVALAVGLFRGSFTETVPVTVISDRAGLVMNPDAKVKMRGVQVGKVASIETAPDGTAALHLAMDPSQLQLIPSNVNVDIASIDGVRREVRRNWWRPTTRHRRRCSAGPGHSEPARHRRDQHRLPAAGLGAGQDRARRSSTRRSARSRGVQRPRREVRPDVDRLRRAAGQDRTRACRIWPRHRGVCARRLNAYADAAPDLVTTVENATTISNSIVDEQQNLDAFLVSAIGLADTGQRRDRRQPPEPDRRAAPAGADHRPAGADTTTTIRCGIGGIVPFAQVAARRTRRSGVGRLHARHRALPLPEDLPKVAAKSGSPCCECSSLPDAAARVRAAVRRRRHRCQPVRSTATRASC